MTINIFGFVDVCYTKEVLAAVVYEVHSTASAVTNCIHPVSTQNVTALEFGIITPTSTSFGEECGLTRRQNYIPTKVTSGNGRFVSNAVAEINTRNEPTSGTGVVDSFDYIFARRPYLGTAPVVEQLLFSNCATFAPPVVGVTVTTTIVVVNQAVGVSVGISNTVSVGPIAREATVLHQTVLVFGV